MHDDIAGRLTAVAEQMRGVDRSLSSIDGLESDDRDIVIVSRFMALQHHDGAWGSDDYPILKPVFTAQGLMTIGLLGIGEAGGISPAVIDPARMAEEWLRGSQRDDGSWGEDAFDTCEVLKALRTVRGISGDDELSRKGLQYLRPLVDADWNGLDSFWSGTGFIGSALEAFNLFNRDNFTAPASNRSAATFGTITSTYDARQVQVGVKVLW